ncbi:hypothetical protein, partial [Rhizobium sp. L74/93]
RAAVQAAVNATLAIDYFLHVVLQNYSCFCNVVVYNHATESTDASIINLLSCSVLGRRRVSIRKQIVTPFFGDVLLRAIRRAS